MKSYLERFGRRIQFWVLVGTEGVRAEDGVVIGRWKTPTIEFYGASARSAVEEFANRAGKADGVRAFTEKYGPLRSGAGTGEPFRFTLRDWREDQERIRAMWRMFATPLEKGAKDAGTHIQVAAREMFRYKGGCLTYKTANIFRFLLFEIAACPPERLLICPRKDCKHPYFIAHDLREKYCSENCSRWATRRSKLAWWNREQRSKPKASKKKSRKSKRR